MKINKVVLVLGVVLSIALLCPSCLIFKIIKDGGFSGQGSLGGSNYSCSRQVLEGKVDSILNASNSFKRTYDGTGYDVRDFRLFEINTDSSKSEFNFRIYGLGADTIWWGPYKSGIGIYSVKTSDIVAGTRNELTKEEEKKLQVAVQFFKDSFLSVLEKAILKEEELAKSKLSKKMKRKYKIDYPHPDK